MRPDSPAPQITHLDPWLKQPVDDEAMDNAIFVGHYGLPIDGVFTIREAIFLSGGPLNWEMWSIHIEYDRVLLPQVVSRLPNQALPDLDRVMDPVETSLRRLHESPELLRSMVAFPWITESAA